MPTPKKNETEKDFVNRCIPYVIKNEGEKPDRASAKCHGIWKQHQKNGEENMEAANGDRDPARVQTLVMNKERFRTKTEAKKWAKDNGYKSNDVRETTRSWRLRQRPVGDFVTGSFRTIDFTDGVVSVIGRIKGE